MGVELALFLHHCQTASCSFYFSFAQQEQFCFYARIKSPWFVFLEAITLFSQDKYVSQLFAAIYKMIQNRFILCESCLFLTCCKLVSHSPKYTLQIHYYNLQTWEVRDIRKKSYTFKLMIMW